MMDIRVLFPEPEGPMMATISPASIVKVAPFNAWTSLSPMGNVFMRFSTRIILASPASAAKEPEATSIRVVGIDLTQCNNVAFSQIARHGHSIAHDLTADHIHAARRTIP